jgi:hypothetical protein
LRCAPLLVALLMAALPKAAAADEAAEARAAIGDDMRAYYGSEKDTASTFGALGVASVGLGVVFAAHDDDFSRGLGWSMLSLGAFEAIGAAFYGLQVDGEAVDYAETLARDPLVFRQREAAHIHGTTSRFVVYRLSELAVSVAGTGVATYGFLTGREVWAGAGIGIAVEAATFLVLDSLGQSRARDYEERIHRFEPPVIVHLDVGGVSGTF